MSTTEEPVKVEEPKLNHEIIFEDGECIIHRATRNIKSEDPILDTMKTLDLKTLIKENHGSDINGAVFNVISEEQENVLLTFASNQVNVYDNTNFKTRLDITMQFINDPNEYVEGGDITGATFVKTAKDKNQGFIAFSDVSNTLGVISIVENRVVKCFKQYKEASKEILQIEADSAQDEVFYILTGDNSIDCWDLAKKSSSMSHNFKSSKDMKMIRSFKDPNVLLIVTKQGALQTISADLKVAEDLLPTQSFENTEKILQIAGSKALIYQRNGNTTIVDVEKKAIVKTLKLPKSLISLCYAFDGRFLCGGNEAGEVVVFDGNTGNEICRPSVHQSNHAVKSLVFDDFSNTLIATTGPFILRWEKKDLV